MNKNEPLITVMIPIYNAEDFLRDCLDSVINQTYKNLEIVLVDDGATDSSGEIADEYAEKDNRVVVIHKTNEGIMKSRITCVSMAHGDYVTFVDSDDWIDEDMYQSVLYELRDTRPDIVTTGMTREYGINSVIDYDEIEEGYYADNDLEQMVFPKAIYSGKFYSAGMMVSVCNKLFKRDIITKVMDDIDENINAFDDAAITYSCLFKSESVKIIKKSYYHYRIRSGSCMDKQHDSEFERIMNLKRHLCSVIPKDDQEYYKKSVDMLVCFALLLQVPEKVLAMKENRIYPFGELQFGDRVVFYGAGRFGNAVRSILLRDYGIHEVACVDKSRKDDLSEVKTVSYLKALSSSDYDYVVINVLKYRIREAIKADLMKMGIPDHKIITINP